MQKDAETECVSMSKQQGVLYEQFRNMVSVRSRLLEEYNMTYFLDYEDFIQEDKKKLLGGEVEKQGKVIDVKFIDWRQRPLDKVEKLKSNNEKFQVFTDPLLQSVLGLDPTLASSSKFKVDSKTRPTNAEVDLWLTVIPLNPYVLLTQSCSSGHGEDCRRKEAG